MKTLQRSLFRHPQEVLATAASSLILEVALRLIERVPVYVRLVARARFSALSFPPNVCGQGNASNC